ncbi:MAG: hypothetical protein ACLVAT_02160 [Lachnospiraceae bacterium]
MTERLKKKKVYELLDLLHIEYDRGSRIRRGAYGCEELIRS